MSTVNEYRDLVTVSKMVINGKVIDKAILRRGRGMANPLRAELFRMGHSMINK